MKTAAYLISNAVQLIVIVLATCYQNQLAKNLLTFAAGLMAIMVAFMLLVILAGMLDEKVTEDIKPTEAWKKCTEFLFNIPCIVLLAAFGWYLAATLISAEWFLQFAIRSLADFNRTKKRKSGNC